LRRGLAPIVAVILGGPLACGDLARSSIETTGMLLAISHRSSGRPRYERKAGLAPSNKSALTK